MIRIVTYEAEPAAWSAPLHLIPAFFAPHVGKNKKYDLVQLPDTTNAYKKINAYLQEDFQKFKNDIEDEDFQRYLV